MWPEVTIRARNQAEVDCLLAALGRAGHPSLVRLGFRIEVGGARPAEILRAVHECLTEYEIHSVQVAIRNGREHVLSKARRT